MSSDVRRTTIEDRLAEALRNLSFAAQISGGVAGRDAGLCEAIDAATPVLAEYDRTRPPEAASSPEVVASDLPPAPDNESDDALVARLRREAAIFKAGKAALASPSPDPRGLSCWDLLAKPYMAHHKMTDRQIGFAEGWNALRDRIRSYLATESAVAEIAQPPAAPATTGARAEAGETYYPSPAAGVIARAGDYAQSQPCTCDQEMTACDRCKLIYEVIQWIGAAEVTHGAAIGGDVVTPWNGNSGNWRADANHIHETVLKAWPAWSDEDKRFLALAMSGEVGELLNLIKKDWRGDEGNRSKGIAEEMVDVRIYLHLLATAYGVDLDRACTAKIPELYRRWPEARATASTRPDGGDVGRDAK